MVTAGNRNRSRTRGTVLELGGNSGLPRSPEVVVVAVRVEGGRVGNVSLSGIVLLCVGQCY